MNGARVPASGTLLPGPIVGLAAPPGDENLSIPEIMGAIQNLFLKSDFALIEKTLRKREDTVREEVASSFRLELSNKAAENAELRAKCKSACTELTTMLGEIKKLKELNIMLKAVRHEPHQLVALPSVSSDKFERLEKEMEVERQSWLEKEETYKKKIAELQQEHGSYALLQAEQKTWRAKEESYNSLIGKLERELKSVTLTHKEAGNQNPDALLRAERQTWKEKEEAYNRIITRLECEIKSGARKEAEDLSLQVKNELMEAIQKLKDSEEAIMNLQKECEEFSDLKVKHEQLMEELNEGKRSEELYEERILELENELKERDKASEKFLEVTSAYMVLEDEKDAAEREALKWRSKYEELEARVSSSQPRKGSKDQFARLRPCQAGIPAEGQTKEKSTSTLGSEGKCISGDGVIDISDSEDEGESIKPGKRRR